MTPKLIDSTGLKHLNYTIQLGIYSDVEDDMV
jgi:hypothetical protein